MNATIEMPVKQQKNVVKETKETEETTKVTKKSGRPPLNIPIPEGIFTTDLLAVNAHISRVTASKKIVKWLESGLITEVNNPNLGEYEGKPGRRPVFYTKI